MAKVIDQTRRRTVFDNVLGGGRRASGGWGGYADVALALAVVATIGMMIVPLPTSVLDVLITANIAAAVTLMLVAIYVAEPLKIATFPTLLLLTTLFRVAIEVAATRLILLHANAGDVIEAFGRFVVSGNLVVGVVIFLILTLVQFVVVAKGAERVAEVGARFTLDAMPGKQLAIDAELRAGHISREEAHDRRRRLGRESQFFGAMDGAMKFVKGDAIAGLLILTVNLVGGLIIGVFQRGLPLGTAARTYTILTIGEGLVSQIPSLVISTAAGVLVTRVSAEEEGGALGREIGKQILAHPKALAFAAGLLAVMALIPGLPAVPFLLLAAAMGFVAQRLLRAGMTSPEALPSVAVPQAPSRVDLPTSVALIVGRELAESLRHEHDRLAPRLAEVQVQLNEVRGVAVSELRTSVSLNVAPRDFKILIHDVPVSQGSCPVDSVLAVTDAHRLTAQGWPAVPARLPDGRSCAWVSLPAQAVLQPTGIVCLQAEDVIAEHLRAVLNAHAHELVGVQETQTLLDGLAQTHPALIAETVPKVIPVVVLAEVLQRLAEERISLRHVRTVLETVAGTRTPEQRAAEVLVQRVRQALKRALTHEHADADGQVSAFVLDPMIEQVLRDGMLRGERPWAFDPELVRDVVSGARRAIGNSLRPIVITNSQVRRMVWRLLATDFPSMTVLSYDELLPETRIETLGQISPAAS